jgi:hypothetical protein
VVNAWPGLVSVTVYFLYPFGAYVEVELVAQLSNVVRAVAGPCYPVG